MSTTATTSSATHEKFIRQALQIARDARSNGNHPFGALLVDFTDAPEGTIALTAENTVNTDSCPTKHAELNLIQKASKELSAEKVKSCVLYTSTEPCPMCCGAIFWSGVRTIVYSFPAESLGAIANDSFCGPCTLLFDRVSGQESQRTTVVGPVLPEEGRAVHGDFWTQFQ